MGSDQRARYQLAHFGDALGDPSRAAMLVALMSGEALSASVLARVAGVSASTATSHLQRLTEAGLVVVRAQGRHRYFALAGPKIADVVERVAALRTGKAAKAPARPRASEEIAAARTCYSHLAGRLAIAFWTRARTAGWVEWSDAGIRLLPHGRVTLARAGLDLEELGGRECIDWTERVAHVAGPLGIATCDAFLARGWLKRAEGTRALRITIRGAEGLRTLRVGD